MGGQEIYTVCCQILFRLNVIQPTKTKQRLPPMYTIGFKRRKHLKKSLINSKISVEVDSYLILMGDWSTTHNKHLELNSMATDDNHMNKPLVHFVKFEREQS